MAKAPSILLTILYFLVTLSIVFGQEDLLKEFSVKLNKEKLTHFHFYFHDIVSGKNPTTKLILPENTPFVFNTSSTYFGSIAMMDDPLTIGPELSSKRIGRAQGFYAAASQRELALIFAMNIIFLEEKYHGSTITVLGRNAIYNEVREMPIIGGSGLFRFARGYVQARTYKLDNTGNAIVEYNAYVLHY